MSASYEAVLFPTSPENPRNGEADIVELPDGTLYLVYGRFTGPEDNAAADFRGLFSTDGGRTWDGEHVMQENIGRENVMCANLLVLQDGRVAFVFMVKNSQVHGLKDCRPYVKFSSDGCRTWTEPSAITLDAPRYYVLENSRLVQLSTGRIVVPLALNVGGDRWWFAAHTAYSDDGGRSWQLSDFATAFDHPETGMVETGVVEIDGARRKFSSKPGNPVLLMYGRSSQGDILHSISVDGGLSWDRPTPLGPRAPISPSLIRRVPQTGDLLLIYNDLDRRVARPQWRAPLTCAISKDEGETWQHVKDLEPDISTSYCYPSVTFTRRDEVVFTYYLGERRDGLHRNLGGLKLKIVPIEWLYS